MFVLPSKLWPSQVRPIEGLLARKLANWDRILPAGSWQIGTESTIWAHKEGPETNTRSQKIVRKED